MSEKTTSKKEAAIASEVLRDPASSKLEKSMAGSALSQAKHEKNKKVDGE